MPEQVSQCPYCGGTDPHQGPTGCPPIKWPPPNPLDPRQCSFYKEYVKHSWREDGVCRICGHTRPEFRSADGYPVEVGKKFWDNDLQVVQITELAERGQMYSDTGESAWWHHHTRGISDTLTGTMQKFGRLGRYFEGLDAEKYEPGTKYADVK